MPYFELTPTTYFYNWLYVNALYLHPKLTEQLITFDAFTDIAFNPDKSINCQARSAALYVSLVRQGMLTEALNNKDSFYDVVYSTTSQSEDTTSQQLDIWGMGSN